MMRAIEYFLSHQSGDRDDVLDLEAALRRRGLASWRDRRNLKIGDSPDFEIQAAIEDETSGFLFYGSYRIIGSDYVWTKEWPWANARRERERLADHPSAYRIAPLLLDGLSYQSIADEAARRGLPSPMDANGESLARGDAAATNAIARKLVRAAVADRAATHSDPIRIRLTTFSGSSGADIDILVDWSQEFDSGHVDWSALLPAGSDLKDELLALSRPIEVDSQARLSAAFAFGHLFPLSSRIDLTAIHRDGDRWRLGAAGRPDAFDDVLEVLPGGDPALAVVEVSLGRSVDTAAGRAVEDLGLNPGRRWSLVGPDAALNGTLAAAASWTFGRRLRELRDSGVHEAHLFIAAPAALVLLLGSSVNAGPAMTIYHTDNGSYRGGLRLPA